MFQMLVTTALQCTLQFQFADRQNALVKPLEIGDAAATLP